MTNKANRPAAHIRHNGIMIDASFNKTGGVDYYVVQGTNGRFYGLHIAKEIAESIARRKAA